MGEYNYYVENIRARFAEDDSDYGCLCVFPHYNKIDIDIVRSLALLGAFTVLASKDLMDNDPCYLPYGIPEWIRKGIDEAIGYEDE